MWGEMVMTSDRHVKAAQGPPAFAEASARLFADRTRRQSDQLAIDSVMGRGPRDGETLWLPAPSFEMRTEDRGAERRRESGARRQP
jgi:hypothetical protein